MTWENFEEFKNYVGKYPEFVDVALYIAEHVAKNFYHYDSEVKPLSYGTKGRTFLVDNDRKVLKVTTDQNEALRAERIRGKHAPGLVGYYDVREITSQHDIFQDYYVSLMDRLPKMLVDDPFLNGIFNAIDDEYHFDSGSMFDSDLYKMTEKQLRKNIPIYFEEKFDPLAKWGQALSKYTPEKQEIIVELVIDIIRIQKTMAKFGIETPDLIDKNLGFDDGGRLTFFDMGYGYEGEGQKTIRKSPYVIERFSTFK